MTGPLHVLSTLAVQGALPGLTAGFEQSAGVRVAADFAPTIGLLARIKAGEAADAAILTREGIDELVGLGLLSGATVVDLVQSLVGLAVKTGAAKPDISTQESLKRALLEARSIAYSRIGASGILFAGLIQQLGIADAVNAKATVIQSGFTGELAARGEVELAVQQVSELMVVPGVDVVGALPAPLQSPAMFSAGVFAGSDACEEATRLVRFLASPEAAGALEAAGLVPVG